MGYTRSLISPLHAQPDRLLNPNKATQPKQVSIRAVRIVKSTITRGETRIPESHFKITRSQIGPVRWDDSSKLSLVDGERYAIY